MLHLLLPLLTALTCIWNFGGTMLEKSLGSHLEMTLGGKAQGGSPNVGFWVSWDWVKQQVQL